MAIPALDPILVLTAFGVGATILLVWMRYDDRRRTRERNWAEWVREHVAGWDGFFGTAGALSGELYRHPPRDPSNLREPEGRKRLEKYCPGLWEKWAALRDAREERNGKLYALYEDMISKLESGVISGSEIPISRRRLIESFTEDVENRSRDKPRLDFELKLGETDDPSKLTTNLVASDKTNPLATGMRNFLEPLLEKIV